MRKRERESEGDTHRERELLLTNNSRVQSHSPLKDETTAAAAPLSRWLTLAFSLPISCLEGETTGW